MKYAANPAVKTLTKLLVHMEICPEIITNKVRSTVTTKQEYTCDQL